MKHFKTIWRQADIGCRIGTTSYIVPAEIIANLRFLKDIVEDVELVLFESDEFSNLPKKSDVREMGRIAEDAGLSFTVHLPLDAWAGAPDEPGRKKSAEKWLRVMDLMSPLSPFGWVVHLNDPPGAPPFDAGAVSPGTGERNPGIAHGSLDNWLDNWLNQCAKTLDSLISRTQPERLCIETLSYDFTPVFPLAVEKNCSVCLDIGHLVMTGQDVSACLDKWFSRTRIIHLHGVRDDGRDHVDLSHIDTRLLDDLIACLKAGGGFPRVLTLEIFSQRDLETSLSILRKSI